MEWDSILNAYKNGTNEKLGKVIELVFINITLNISTFCSLDLSLQVDRCSVGCCWAMVSSLLPFSGGVGYSNTGSGVPNNWLSTYYNT